MTNDHKESLKKCFTNYIICVILFGLWFINIVNLFNPEYTYSIFMANCRLFSALSILPGIVWGFIDILIFIFRIF